MIGRRLGPWVIAAEIGRGAMGTVYRAHRADDPGAVVALKILNADLARDDVFVARPIEVAIDLPAWPDPFQTEALAFIDLKRSSTRPRMSSLPAHCRSCSRA